MGKFKKKLNIDNATAFKLEYYEGGKELKTKEFNSFKSMEQFHNRQNNYLYLDCNRYAFIDDAWHRFIKLQSPIVFQQDMNFLNNTFNEPIEEKNLHKFNNEE